MDESFDALFVSPLTRARQTAEIVAGGKSLTARVLPQLREIDLYSFQVRCAAWSLGLGCGWLVGWLVNRSVGG